MVYVRSSSNKQQATREQVINIWREEFVEVRGRRREYTDRQTDRHIYIEREGEREREREREKEGGRMKWQHVKLTVCSPDHRANHILESLGAQRRGEEGRGRVCALARKIQSENRLIYLLLKQSNVSAV